MPFGLPDDVLLRLLAVLSGYRKIRQIILYGSRAKGTARPGLDIDLCLDGGALSFEGWISWRLQLTIWFFTEKRIVQSGNRSTILI